jgi:hypothetical protein
VVESASRAEVLAFRVRAQQLDRAGGSLAQTAALDLGVQDTGPDGGLWALANRGVEPPLDADALVSVWTLRGAPHLYRRADLNGVAAAVEPFSEADASKRIFDAARPLKAAGVSTLEALDVVAAAMRSLVEAPTVKGDVSGALSSVLGPPYVRWCQPCGATHVYEMPFRLAALRAGVELQPGTSPPVLQRIPGFSVRSRGAGAAERTQPVQVPSRFDVIRCYLRLLGPATPKYVAEFLDAPIKDVKARWPSDAIEVTVEDETRWLVAEDVTALGTAPAEVTRLLGPYDLFLQARDRKLLVDEPGQAKQLWPVLGRPGAVLLSGGIAGAWRARKTGPRLRVTVELWKAVTARERAAVVHEAERLAGYRRLSLDGVDFAV